MTDKNHEVEFRALISRDIFTRIREQAAASPAHTIRGPLTIVDAYFCSQSVTSFKEIEMNKVGSYSLRLRSEREGDAETSSMNTKIIRSEGDHNAWLEHEIGISSFDQAEQILKTIGFKKYFELRKQRYSFDDAGVHVCLEDIADFQPAIEVEIMATQNTIEEAKKNLLAYLDGHGITQDMIVKKSITNLLMREKARF